MLRELRLAGGGTLKMEELAGIGAADIVWLIARVCVVGC